MTVYISICYNSCVNVHGVCVSCFSDSLVLFSFMALVPYLILAKFNQYMDLFWCWLIRLSYRQLNGKTITDSYQNFSWHSGSEHIDYYSLYIRKFRGRNFFKANYQTNISSITLEHCMNPSYLYVCILNF